MPKVTIGQSDETAERIFGGGATRVRIPDVSRKTHIAVSTLRGWKNRPETMTLYGFARIARSTGMTDEQMLKVIKGIK